ncbi:MAG TPA: serine hydrolase domain-containing protein [Tepidisphaeraceae bacterium]|jgi:CubicO group peptidase (beta-lactamase class C family)|nr:serine hydrolase domain-containing protein [Tepidisphaeraceae bacterium]
MNLIAERVLRWVLLPALFLCGCAPVQKRSDPPPVFDPDQGYVRGDAFDDAMHDWMKSQHIPGMALAIVEDGHVSKAQGYGLADVEREIPVRPDTAFEIGSLSKPFLATGVMMLMEESRLRLDDPLSKYLDRTPKVWKDITLRNLLTHTSGIPDLFNDPIEVNSINLFGLRIVNHHLELSGDRTEQSVFDLLAKQPLKFPPGTRYSYSNSGYVLLAMVIHKVTGKPYGVFLHKRIFEPLGMTRTCIFGDVPSLPDSAVGYQWEKDHLIRKWLMLPTIDGKGYGNGGIVTTVLDLAMWDAGLSSGKLVSKSTLDQMWQPGRLNDGTEIPYGLGWGLAKVPQVPGRRIVFHAGRWGVWGGFASLFQRFVNERVTLIFLANQPDADWPSMPQTIWQPYLPEPAHPMTQPSGSGKH